MKIFRCEQCFIETKQCEVMIIPHCSSCGDTRFMVEVETKEKSDRELALEWWNNLSQYTRSIITSNTRSVGLSTLVGVNLTGSEIEEIWRKETQEKEQPKQLVDFEMLKNTFEHLPKLRLQYSIDELKPVEMYNLHLFFQKLSESSSFAHKAHKSLKQLNK